MREILFRGKTTKDKEWVYGDLLHDGYDYDVAIWEKKYKLVTEISPKTVGQFTGLTDKNGKKIFEGDVVRGRHWTSRYDKSSESFNLWRVDWSEKSGLITFVDSPTNKARLSIHDFEDFGEVEVIGNIHDNPELLQNK